MTTPVLAANASLPVITVTSNNPVLGASAGNVVTVKVANPSGNAYTVTGVSAAAPAGWTITACGIGGFLSSCSFSASGVTWTVASFTVGTAAGIPPSIADSMTFTATAPTAAGSYPINSIFTTLTQDASALSFYTGPSFTVQVIDPATVVTIAVTPGGANLPTQYTAGTAPYTVTATVTAPEAQAGLTIVWSDTGTGAGSATYPSSFGAASSTTAAATSTTATASTTFQPSQVSGLTGIPKAKISTCGAAGCSATSGTTIMTIAGTPSSVAALPTGGSTTKTNYVTAFGTPSFATAGTLYATIATGALTGTVADAYGNAVTSGISGQACTLTAFGGSFDAGAGSSVSFNAPPAGASCSTAGAIASTLSYFQAGAFASTGYVQVTMTGTYTGGIAFTANGKTTTLSTSTFDSGASAIPVPTPAAGTISAGSAAGVVSTISLTYTLTNKQVGVPVTFFGVNTTNPYAGSFVGGTGTSFHKGAVVDFANITVSSVLNSAGTAAIATVTFTIDPTVGAAVTFKAQVTAPLTATPSNKLTLSGATGTFTTIAGAASKLLVKSFFDVPATIGTKYAVPGQTIYVNVLLVDYWGNTALQTGGQLQIALSASPSSAGVFSATSVYISTAASDTKSSFGTITFAVASGAALGTVTFTATGFFSGSGTLSIVSPNPTVSVTTPSGTIGHTIYSAFSGVGYAGTAAVSKGVFPVPTIASVSYTIDGGSTLTATGTTAWSFVATLAQGLHTVVVWSKDSAGLLSATNSTTVLVDTSPPTITAPTTLAYGAGTPVVFTITDTLGDLNAASVKATSNSSATLTTTVTGTNNPGSSVTYTVSVAGLPATTGHWSLTLNAKDLAGNAATASTVVVQVTVQQAQSLVVQGTPTPGKIGSYQGVSVTYQNVWSSSQSVVVFAVWKNSLGQTVYISAGSATLANGASQSFFLPEVGLASGTYTVNLFVWTTSNTSVSVTTPVTVTF